MCMGSHLDFYISFVKLRTALLCMLFSILRSALTCLLETTKVKNRSFASGSLYEWAISSLTIFISSPSSRSLAYNFFCFNFDVYAVPYLPLTSCVSSFTSPPFYLSLLSSKLWSSAFHRAITFGPKLSALARGQNVITYLWKVECNYACSEEKLEFDRQLMTSFPFSDTSY